MLQDTPPPLVLIIDDDAGDVKLIRRMLNASALTCEICAASSVPQALHLFEDHAVDFIFLDHGLPSSDGIANLEQLRTHWPGAAIATITGQGDEEIAAAAIKGGAIDYIPKRNITPPALDRMVRKGLEVTNLRLRLETQRAELDTFAHTLAHDLKAPLRALDYFTESLSDDLVSGNCEAAREDVGEIAALVARLNRTIDDLSQHLKFDPDVVYRPEQAEDLVHAAKANLHAEFAERAASLHHDPLPVVLCSRTEIIQLFQNLIGNGIKYCPDHQPLIRVGADSAENGRWLFYVRDNGIGVPAEHADRIFQPFLRLHREEEFQGTGLGLATCTKIVERHGGRIWCEPQDQGTLIRFCLPDGSAWASASQTDRANGASGLA